MTNEYSYNTELWDDPIAKREAAIGVVRIADFELHSIPVEICIPSGSGKLCEIVLKIQKSYQMEFRIGVAFALFAESNLDSTATRTTYRANDVQIVRTRPIGRGPGQTEVWIKALSTGIIRETIRSLAQSNSNWNPISFRLSHNSKLSSYRKQIVGVEGSVSVSSRAYDMSVPLRDGGTIQLEKRFSHREQEPEQIILSSTLYLRYNPPALIEDLLYFQYEVLPKIERLLIIITFLTGIPTYCTGWTMYDEKRSADAYFVNPEYRDGFVVARPAIDQRLRNLAISGFLLSSTIKALENFDNFYPIEKAVKALVPGHQTRNIPYFMSMFSAIEELIDDFRNRESIGRVLGDEEWKILKKELMKSIKESALGIGQDERCLIYTKLNELNRSPLSHTFVLFAESCDLDLADLWPLFDRCGGAALYDLRNRLVHGQGGIRIDDEVVRIACLQIAQLLERILFSVLKIKISPGLKLPPTQKLDYTKAREKLTELLKG